jgi:carboxyl-terminal processing protease
MTDMTLPSRRVLNPPPTPPARPGAGRLPGLARLASAAALLAACAGSPPPPSSGPPGREPAAPDPRLQPPPFAATAPVPPAAREDRRTAERREILDAAWRTVRDKHYDPKLGGLDWEAVRRRYEPRALAAPDDAAFYRALNDMIGELGQSHMMITGPGASDDDDLPDPADPAAAAAPSNDVGDPGLTVRVIEGRPTITAVRPGSSAALHGLAPGYLVTAIGGRPLTGVAPHRRSLRPVEERFAVRRAALHRLQGPAGTKVTLDFLDNQDRAGQVVLDRDRPAGPVRQIGYLPPLHPEARVQEIAGVGVIAFNIFLLDPLLDDIKRAVDRFVKTRVKGLILDLRGNPGGLGAMAIPVASELVTVPTTLGTMVMRDGTHAEAVTTFAQTFVAQPALGRTPYSGPLVVLTDEGTASAAEILAAGLQESGRATVIGDASLGAVLPSVVESLPHGAVMQVVVADFKTPKGVLLEGRGVQPDQRVLETRAGFRGNHDPVLEAAVQAILARGARRPAAVTTPARAPGSPPSTGAATKDKSSPPSAPLPSGR